MKFYTYIAAILLIGFIAGCGGGGSDTNSRLGVPQEVDTTPEPFDISKVRAQSNQNALMRVALNFWVVTSDVRPDISYDVSNPQIQEYLDGVNKIWAAADIAFDIKQVQRIVLDEDLSNQYAAFLGTNLEDRSVPLDIIDWTGQYNPIFGELNIVLLKEFGDTSGTALPIEGVIFLAEATQFNEIRRPTVFAHELGHTLGLGHVERGDRECNLMDAGRCGLFNQEYTQEGILVKSLHPCQVEIARASVISGIPVRITRDSVSCFNQAQ